MKDGTSPGAVLFRVGVDGNQGVAQDPTCSASGIDEPIFSGNAIGGANALT